MFEEIAKTIKAQLHERATSPLLGTFTVSWIAWNYRFLLALVSDLPFKEKIAFIDQVLYPCWQQHLLQGLAFPLVSSVVFMVVYPWPARWAFSYWRGQQKRTKGIQQKIDDETPLTREEARKLRQEGISEALKFESDLQKLSTENNRLRVLLKDAQDSLASKVEMPTESEESGGELSKYELSISDEEYELLKLIGENGSSGLTDVELRKLAERMPAKRYSYALGQLMSYQLIDRSNGRVWPKQEGLRYLLNRDG